MNYDDTAPADALDRICIPIERVRLLGHVIGNSNTDIKASRPFDGYSVEGVWTIGDMLVDAAENLHQLFTLAQEHEQKQHNTIQALKNRVLALESGITHMKKKEEEQT